MKTSKQVEEEFRAKLNALLKEFSADIELVDIGEGFLGDDTRMFAHIRPIFNNNDELIADNAYFDLGDSIKGE